MVEPNSELGNYQLGERLGRGGTADVFKAFQSGVERDVAIKVMFSHLADDPEFAPRFQREARAMGQLQHPNIARVIDFDATTDPPFMVMEYLGGGSLADLIDELPGPLPVANALRIGRQLAEALRYAHRLGMVHRDIKPGNVMFSDDERRHAVLMDFGMARLVDEGMTATGTVLGTPAYMAPEQVRGEGAGASADLYSLGVLLYQLVTGELPYAADSVHSLMLKHTTDPIPSARAANRAVSLALSDFLITALAKQPEDRFESADEFLTALAAIDATPSAQSDAVTSGANETVVSQAPRALTPTPSKSRGLALVAACVVGVVAVASATYVFATSGDDSSVATIESTDEVRAEVADDESTYAQPGYGSSSEAAAPVPTASQQTSSASDEQRTEQAYYDRLVEIAMSEPAPLAVVSVVALDDRIALAVERARQPSPDTDWVLWLDTSTGPVGHVVEVDDEGRGRVDFANLDAADVVGSALSEAPAGSTLVGSDAPAMQTSLDEDELAEMVQRVELLDALEPQIALAIDHSGFIREELDLGDLGQAHRHAEHVVNILAGSDGELFSDLDENGLAENPGDGVGIDGYAVALAGLPPLAPDGFDYGWDRSAALAIEQRSLAAQVDGIEIAADAAIEASFDALAQLEDKVTAIRADSQRMRNELRTARVRSALGDLFATGMPGSIGSLDVAPGLESLHVRLELSHGSRTAGELPQGGDVVFDELGRGTIALPGAIGPVEIKIEGAALGETIDARLEPSSLERFQQFAGVDGLLASATEQVAIAATLVDDLDRASSSGDHDQARRIAEQVVALFEGTSGTHVGDMDGNGTAEDPGDGTGVLVYLDQIDAVAGDFAANTVEQSYYRGLFTRSVSAQRQAAQRAVDDGALRLLATDTIDEAQPSIDVVIEAIRELQFGFDADANGVVDPLAGEGGMNMLRDQAATLLSNPIFG